MIISGVLCQDIKPLIHNNTQLHAIFTFCSNEKLDQFDCSYMYTQILKEILLTITFEQQHIKQFIDYCHEQFDNNNHHEFNEIKNSNKDIKMKHLFGVLSVKAYILRSIIDDLHRHIEKIYSEQFGGHHITETFTLYRGQGLPKTDFDQMMNTKGGLISFNNFLSTSKDRDVSFAFAESNARNPDLVGILFVITIDSLISSTPFAFIKDEILFSMHTVFRICDIKAMEEKNRLYQMNLTLTNDNDQDLCILTDRIPEETFPDSIG